MQCVIHSFLQNLVYIFFAAGNIFIPISMFVDTVICEWELERLEFTYKILIREFLKPSSQFSGCYMRRKTDRQKDSHFNKRSAGIRTCVKCSVIYPKANITENKQGYY